MTTDPNAAARDLVRAALRTAGIDATDRLLDVVIDATLAGDRDDAIVEVIAYAGIPRGRAAMLVDLATEALTNGGHL